VAPGSAAADVEVELHGRQHLLLLDVRELYCSTYERTNEASVHEGVRSIEVLERKTRASQRVPLLFANRERAASSGLQAQAALREEGGGERRTTAASCAGFAKSGRGGGVCKSLDAERFDEAAEGVKELLDFSATHPEIPEGERAHMSRALLEARAFIASRRGDLEQAEEHLARMKKIDGVRASSIEWVERDLASHRGDLEALDGLFEHAQPGCNGKWERARATALAGAPQQALTQLNALFQADLCGPIGAERWAHALALALAADLDAERRAERLSQFDEVWPAPDADLPVVQRVRALQAR